MASRVVYEGSSPMQSQSNAANLLGTGGGRKLGALGASAELLNLNVRVKSHIKPSAVRQGKANLGLNYEDTTMGLFAGGANQRQSPRLAQSIEFTSQRNNNSILLAGSHATQKYKPENKQETGGILARQVSVDAFDSMVRLGQSELSMYENKEIAAAKASLAS